MYYEARHLPGGPLHFSEDTDLWSVTGYSYTAYFYGPNAEQEAQLYTTLKKEWDERPPVDPTWLQDIPVLQFLKEDTRVRYYKASRGARVHTPSGQMDYWEVNDARTNFATFYGSKAEERAKKAAADWNAEEESAVERVRARVRVFESLGSQQWSVIVDGNSESVFFGPDRSVAAEERAEVLRARLLKEAGL